MAKKPKFEIRQVASTIRQFYGRLVAANGEVVLVSEAYPRRYNVKRWAERIRQLAKEAEVVDLTGKDKI